jgi:hypothetical protein
MKTKYIPVIFEATKVDEEPQVTCMFTKRMPARGLVAEHNVRAALMLTTACERRKKH